MRWSTSSTALAAFRWRIGGLTRAGLTQASGRTATAIAADHVDAMTQFMGVMTDPFGAGRRRRSERNAIRRRGRVAKPTPPPGPRNGR